MRRALANFRSLCAAGQVPERSWHEVQKEAYVVASQARMQQDMSLRRASIAEYDWHGDLLNSANASQVSWMQSPRWRTTLGQSWGKGRGEKEKTRSASAKREGRVVRVAYMSAPFLDPDQDGRARALFIALACGLLLGRRTPPCEGVMRVTLTGACSGTRGSTPRPAARVRLRVSVLRARPGCVVGYLSSSCPWLCLVRNRERCTDRSISAFGRSGGLVLRRGAGR
jgi:hypothetical protein